MLRFLSPWDARYLVCAGRQPRSWGIFPISVVPVDTESTTVKRWSVYLAER
jgi:hypothetical protein